MNYKTIRRFLVAASLVGCTGQVAQVHTKGSCPIRNSARNFAETFNSVVSLDETVRSEYDQDIIVPKELREEILNSVVRIDIEYSLEDGTNAKSLAFGLALKDNLTLASGNLITEKEHYKKKVLTRKMTVDGYNLIRVEVQQNAYDIQNFALLEIDCPYEEGCLNPFPGEISKTPSSGDFMAIVGLFWPTKEKILVEGKVKGIAKILDLVALSTMVEVGAYPGPGGSPGFVFKTNQETGEITPYFAGTVLGKKERDLFVTIPTYVSSFLERSELYNQSK